MCLKIIDCYTVCGHNGRDDPNVASCCEVEKCPEWDGTSCPRLRSEDAKYEGKCWACSGDHDAEKFWYKHCDQSNECDHEFNHMLTNLRRFPEEEDIVLVTPRSGLCPECTEAGYDRRPGATMKAASVMPREFEGLSRKPMTEVPRVSMVPSATLRPASPEALRASRVPSSTYNPAASRAPQSKAPSVRPSHAPSYTSQAPRQSQVPSASKYPNASRAPNASQLPRESRQPSKYPISTAPSVKPATQLHTPISKIPEETQKPALTPTALLRRGPPKNVSPSAFYDNADGEEARARLGSATVAPNHSGHSTYPSAAPKARTSAPQEYVRTRAPPSDAAGPDLDELMSTASITPSASQYPASRRPAGQTGFPATAMASQAPAASRVPASTRPSMRPAASRALDGASRAPQHPRPSEAPRHSQMPSPSRAPPASTVPKQSQAPSPSSRPSTRPSASTAPNTASRVPENPSTARPSTRLSPSPAPNSASHVPGNSSTARPPASARPQPGPAAPPSYHTQANPQSAITSKAPPPQQGGFHSVAPSSSAPKSVASHSSAPRGTAARVGGRNADGRQVSTVPEGDEGTIHY